MSHFVIVQGEQEAEVKRVFARAVAVFETLTGLSQCGSYTAGSTAVALFPSIRGVAPAVDANRKHGGIWAAGAGSFWHGRSTGREALGNLVGQMRQGNELLGSLSDVDGCFALAIVKSESGELLVITDRIGSLHVYQAEIGSCVAISTSSLALASLCGRGMDPLACNEFLATGTVFESRSLFEDVKKLSPATEHCYRGGRLQTARRYWDLKAVMYDRARRRGSVPELAEALRKSLERVVEKFPRPVLDLTGGFDSRALLGAMRRTGLGFHTVVCGEPNDADVRTAGVIAETFGLAHRHLMLPANWPETWWARAKSSIILSDGECNALEYAAVLENHSRLADEFDISINGSGGEITKGYWWELLFPRTGGKHFDERMVAARRFAFDASGAALLQPAWRVDPVEHFAGIIRRANAGMEDYPNTAKMDNVYLTLRMQRWQGRLASATSRIWPCISPFMMREPMEISLSVPPSRRVRHRMTRRLIEYLDPRLAALPLAQGYPALPLRPSTATQFLPMALEISKKVSRRVRRKLVGEKTSGQVLPQNSLEAIWQSEECREIMAAGSMQTASLYETESLDEFVGAAARPGFRRGLQLARLITLELTSRAVSAASISLQPVGIH